ncbi:VWA domain-containing protein [bacterium]|nr:VWA domain-containing protein [bacterium]
MKITENSPLEDTDMTQKWKIKAPMLLAGLLLTCASLGCKPNEYAGTEKKSIVSSSARAVSCAEEKSKAVTLKSTDTRSLSFSKACVSDSSTARTPADIIFVIDVTGSMQDSLNTVKNGVEQFAGKLRQDKGWDARYAAVAFRDGIAAQVPFTDEKTLASRIRMWMADGGDDPQEAGQLAIATALQIINQDTAANPQRASANKVIMFIGDAIAYALNGNHDDFSTGQLESLFAQIPAIQRNNFKFYFSAAREVDECLVGFLFGCAKMGKGTRYAAQPQISALAQRLNLPGKGFDFPFTENILLNEFIEEFQPGQSCQWTSAVARNSAGQELARANESAVLKLPTSLQESSVQLEVERCCSVSQADSVAKASCKPNKATLSINLNQ